MNFLTVLRDPETGKRLQSFRTYCADTWKCTKDEVRKILAEAKRHEQEMVAICCPKMDVFTFLEDWDSAIFWALVFFRPVHLPRGSRVRLRLPDSPSWVSVYDILTKLGGDELTQSGLGLIYDDKHNYLTLLWKEAFSEKGILHGLDHLELWHKVKAEYRKHSFGRELNNEVIQAMAMRHSWVVPESRLLKLKYRKKHLWHRGKLGWDDFLVFALNGIEVVRTEARKKDYIQAAETLPPIQMQIDHPNIYDKVLYQHSQSLVEPIRRKEGMTDGEREARSAQKRIAGQVRTAKRKDRLDRELLAATRTVCRIARLFGANPVRKFPKLMAGKQALDRFFVAADNYIFGRVDPKREALIRGVALKRLVDQLRELTEHSSVPVEFRHWLVLEKPVDDVAAYVRQLAMDSSGKVNPL